MDREAVRGRIVALLSELPTDRRLALRLGCLVFELLARVRFFSSFERLSDDAVLRVTSFCSRSPLSPLRRLGRVTVMLSRFAAYMGEETWAAIGYDGPWLGRRDVVAGPPPQLGGER